jgi:DNA topoisomerase-3
MIAGRMLEAFSTKCIKDATTIILACSETLFEAKGSIIKQAGWRAVFGEKEETDEDETGVLLLLRCLRSLPELDSVRFAFLSHILSTLLCSKG